MTINRFLTESQAGVSRDILAFPQPLALHRMLKVKATPLQPAQLYPKSDLAEISQVRKCLDQSVLAPANATSEVKEPQDWRWGLGAKTSSQPPFWASLQS